MDLDQIAQIPNVDVIVGGDSHTLLGDNLTFLAANLFPLGPYATMVGDVFVVQAWEYGKIVGRLDVQFDEAGVVTSCVGIPQIPFGSNGSAYEIEKSGTYLDDTLSEEVTASLLAWGIFANVTSDPDIVAAIVPFQDALDESLSLVLGVANTSICHNKEQRPEPLCPNRELSTCLGGGSVCYLVAQGFLYNAPPGRHCHSKQWRLSRKHSSR
jgi:5'-nucleotidase / UDP-sugar diphosphatase